jgi:hypothetical protein
LLSKSIALAMVLDGSAARAEPTGPRVELVPGATVNIGLLHHHDPWFGRGVALRVLVPRSDRGRPLEVAADWQRFGGANLDGPPGHIDHERFDRLRLTGGARFRAGQPDRPHGYARLAAGVDLTDGEVRLVYGGLENPDPETTYETRSDRSAGIVAAAGAGYEWPLGPVSIAIELDVAAGVHFGQEDLSRIHEPGGPFAEAQLLVAVGCALW